MSSANVTEIFSSVQGEGKFLGCRQIFVRTADCNLNCAYCDTDFARADFCRVETFAGSGRFRTLKNPLDAAQVVKIVKNFAETVPTHSISFTGGEPLLNRDFVSEIARVAKNFGLKTFLETNGTLFDDFAKISAVIDIVSMDLKLPSAGQNLFVAHEKFLRNAVFCKDLYVKIVIAENSSLDEFLTAVKLVSSVNPKILLVIQPVTPANGVKAASAAKILDFQAAALKFLDDVRVIPQTHKIFGAL